MSRRDVTTVGVFAPSSPFPRDRFDAGITILKNLGFEIRMQPDLEAKSGFLAGSDTTRRDGFLALLNDPTVDAVIAARGGYGAHRLLEITDFGPLPTKPVVGFSDVCALHAALAHAGGQPIHGPVVTQLASLAASDHQHLATLLRTPSPFVMKAEQAISPGLATGPLAGGCLSVVAPLVGTPHLYLPEGAILLLEDVGEATYRVDRMLTHLRLSGLLGRVAGIGIGDMVGCRPQREGEQTIEAVLSERLGDLGIPVLTGLPFGHGQRNLAWPLAAAATMDAETCEVTVTP